MNYHQLDLGRNKVYIVQHRPGFMNAVPLGRTPADCFVLAEHSLLDEAVTSQVATEIASLNNDWVETCGPCAEILHDAIDEASVAIGRQASVGDGSPMTAWHDELITPHTIAEYIRLGGLGFQLVKLVVVIGSDDYVRAIVVALEEKKGPEMLCRKPWRAGDVSPPMVRRIRG